MLNYLEAMLKSETPSSKVNSSLTWRSKSKHENGNWSCVLQEAGHLPSPHRLCAVNGRAVLRLSWHYVLKQSAHSVEGHQPPVVLVAPVGQATRPRPITIPAHRLPTSGAPVHRGGWGPPAAAAAAAAAVNPHSAAATRAGYKR